ncbi:MAG: toxin YoeB [bacterium]|nr:MAG: toxin YoeB [bacterium]
MRSLELDPSAFEDLEWWVQTNRKKSLEIIQLIQEIQRNPFQGTGKPKKLKHDLSGCWSMKIDEEHRIVYKELWKKK